MRWLSLEAAELVMEEQQEDTSRAERVSAQESPHREQHSQNAGQQDGKGQHGGRASCRQVVSTARPEQRFS